MPFGLPTIDDDTSFGEPTFEPTPGPGSFSYVYGTLEPSPGPVYSMAPSPGSFSYVYETLAPTRQPTPGSIPGPFSYVYETLAPTRQPTPGPIPGPDVSATAVPEPDGCPEQPRRRLSDCVTYPCACQDHPGKCIVVGSMGEGGVRCSHGTRPHVSEEFCNTVTETEGGYCGGEKYPVAAGAFCKWTFCPAPATTS